MEKLYDKNAILTNNTTSSTQVGLHWSIREEESRIELAIAIHLPNDEYLSINNNNDGQIEGPPLFWVGFGMSEMGGTKGSDMFVFSFFHGKVLDCHYGAVEESGLPRIDECGQDWILNNYNFSSNKTTESKEDSKDSLHLVVEVSRPLQAGDVNEDLPFLRDTSMAIPATNVFITWGDIIKNDSTYEQQQQNSEEGFFDLSLWMKPHNEASIVTRSLRFFEDDAKTSPQKKVITAEKQQQQETLEFIDLIPSSAFHVPANTTTYKNFCFSIVELVASDDSAQSSWLLEDGAHIVKFEDILSSSSTSSTNSSSSSSVDIVHHMDLHGTNNPILGKDSRLCDFWDDFVHPWEAGSERIVSLPESAGFPLGGTNGGYLGFRVEVHYHNPNHHVGILDQSGVRIWYTRKKRKYDAGIMQLGDPKLVLRGLPTSFWPDDDDDGVGRPNSNKDNIVGTTTSSSIRGTNQSADKVSAATAMQHSFYCPPACFSRERMGQQYSSFSKEEDEENENVIVFKEVMHMHSTGSRMTNIQLDARGETKRTSEINYFDFNKGAGYHVRQESYSIDAGDSFVSTCYFDNDTKGRKVVFGSGSNEEMCQTFLWYYPSAAFLDEEESEPLYCGYWDESLRNSASRNDTSIHGCEVGYYASVVDNNMNRNYHSSYKGNNNNVAKNGSGICLAALPFDSWNSRPPKSYPTYSKATLSSWPSLQMSIEGVLEEEQNDTNSTRQDSSNQTILNGPSNCSLCLDGERPLHPNVSLEDYFGSKTTCDSLDAWIRVLFLQPDLVGYSWQNVPPCSEYYLTFGERCGCSSNANGAASLLLQVDGKSQSYMGHPDKHLLLVVVYAMVLIGLFFLRDCISSRPRISISSLKEGFLEVLSAFQSISSSDRSNNTQEMIALT